VTDPLMHAARLRAYSDIMVEHGRDEEARGLRETADAIEADSARMRPGATARPILLEPPTGGEYRFHRAGNPFHDHEGNPVYPSNAPTVLSGHLNFRERVNLSLQGCRSPATPGADSCLLIPLGGREFLVPIRWGR
jgi:hypothetical protein